MLSFAICVALFVALVAAQGGCPTPVLQQWAQDSAALGQCVQNAGSSFPALCNCYSTFVNASEAIPGANACPGFNTTISGIENACTQLQCVGCGNGNSTLPTCSTAQDAVLANAGQQIQACTQAAGSNLPAICKCLQAYIAATKSCATCQAGHVARESVRSGCQSIGCSC